MRDSKTTNFNSKPRIAIGRSLFHDFSLMLFVAVDMDVDA